ncbi:MAG TPA: hypothetical protein VH394_03290 [Thermoanaerobaculia bacterium]|nr:hypothetical protein [Thermoanaerobaculia bacterium]
MRAFLAPATDAGERPVQLLVTTAPTFFNPRLGQSGQIRLSASRPGNVTVEILDRDRFVVRTLGPLPVERETVTRWDGKDDAGEVVPDEAYTVRARFVSAGDELVYDPGRDFQALPVSIGDTSYSRVDSVLSYRLERPSRVHIQAGQAQPVAGGPARGPVLRTIVDRAPRAGGAVIESWNGMDESGKVYIPDLQHFAVAVLAVPLPESSLITVGNRGVSFTEYARRHRAASLTRPRKLAATAHSHHQGLNAFEDRSPRLVLSPAKRGDSSAWKNSADEALEFSVGLDRDTAPFFLSQPNVLDVFIDADPVLHVNCRANPCPVRLPAERVPRGRHRLGVNWSSELGPVGVAVRWVEKP